MPFPKTTRVIYDKNPLVQVICQIRFPTTLKIDLEVPAEFQERIRNEFPKFSEKKDFRIEMPAGMQDDIPPEILNRILQTTSGNTNYQFVSEDEDWKVNLTRSFIALSSYNYHHWEEFLEKLKKSIEAINEIYSPKKYSRVGLRYINVIHRSKLGLSDIDWSKLIKPYVLGILGFNEICDYVKTFQNMYEIQLSNNVSLVRMRSKFVTSTNNEKEKCYHIDNDFIHEKNMNVEEVFEMLNYLRERGSRCFRWCIEEQLHKALGPEEL